MTIPVDESFWTGTAAGAIRAATPLVLAGLGQIVYERSGVLNLALEGFLLVGAFTSVAAQLAGLPWFASLAVAALATGLAGLLHAGFCVKLRTHQAVTGLAFLFVFQGLTAVLGRQMVGRPIEGTHGLTLEFTRSIPLLGSTLSGLDWIVALTAILVGAVGFFLRRTSEGIRLRACGESATSARKAGVSVGRTRLWAGAICGVFAGVGGGYVALFSAQQWQENMISGRGWIALVLVIFARWQPVFLLAGALLFGGLTSLQLNLQVRGVGSSQYLLAMAPFLVTVLVLAVSAWRLKRHSSWMPADLGRPFADDADPE